VRDNSFRKTEQKEEEEEEGLSYFPKVDERPGEGKEGRRCD
jgi:hypothetical protein